MARATPSTESDTDWNGKKKNWGVGRASRVDVSTYFVASILKKKGGGVEPVGNMTCREHTKRAHADHADRV